MRKLASNRYTLRHLLTKRAFGVSEDDFMTERYELRLDDKDKRALTPALFGDVAARQADAASRGDKFSLLIGDQIVTPEEWAERLTQLRRERPDIDDLRDAASLHDIDPRTSPHGFLIEYGKK